MKRIQYHRYGGPEVLRLEEAELAPPGNRQVVIEIRAAAANAMDWKIRNADMRLMTIGRFPRGVGHDFAGVVKAVGQGVTDLHVDDAVLGAASMRHPGAFAEAITADQDAIALKPAALSFEQAAALPIVGVTAFQALFNAADLQSGQTVFVHGCLGGVGRAAVQLASHHGASVAGSCRITSASAAAELGVDPVVAFDVDPAPLRRRFDLIFDTTGSLPIATARALLKPGGRILDIVPTARKLLRSLTPGPYAAFMGRPNANDLRSVADAAARGDLVIPIARIAPLADAIRALAELETDHNPRNGKLIITMN